MGLYAWNFRTAVPEKIRRSLAISGRVALEQVLRQIEDLKKDSEESFRSLSPKACCHLLSHIPSPSEVLGVDSIPSIPVCSVQ